MPLLHRMPLLLKLLHTRIQVIALTLNLGLDCLLERLQHCRMLRLHLSDSRLGCVHRLHGIKLHRLHGIKLHRLHSLRMLLFFNAQIFLRVFGCINA